MEMRAANTTRLEVKVKLVRWTTQTLLELRKIRSHPIAESIKYYDKIYYHTLSKVKLKND